MSRGFVAPLSGEEAFVLEADVGPSPMIGLAPPHAWARPLFAQDRAQPAADEAVAPSEQVHFRVVEIAEPAALGTWSGVVRFRRP